jgi:O-methyltransferase domain/Dimerisation domain
MDVNSAAAPDGAPQVPAALHMMQLLSGFEFSQALYTVAKLGVATALAEGPRTVAELAVATGSNEDALRRIIRFVATLGVFVVREDTVEVTALGMTLAEGPVDSMRDIALYFMETQYAPFGDLLHTARTGETAATRYFGKHFLEWITDFPELVAIQNGAMANATNGMRAGMFYDYRLPPGTTVADIGGSDGTVLSRLLANDPQRRAIVFDRPQVVAGAHKVLAAAGLADRISVAEGDFFVRVPPADVYVLSHILHDWDDPDCLRILDAITRAASSPARLVAIESVVPEDNNPHFAKMTDIAMLTMVGGRERTAAEYTALLAAGGFTVDRILPSATPYSFIEATMQ